MKKILIVSTYIPPFAGGAERAAWQIASGLKERFEVHVLTTSSQRSNESKQGVMIHNVRYHYPLSLYYSTFGKKHLDEIFSKYNFDLISIHLVLPWGYLLRGYPAKKIITDHGMDFYIYRRNWIINLNAKHKARAAFSRASAVTSVSKLAAEKIKNDFGIEVKHIPNGVDLKRFYADNSRERQNVILFLGRFIEMKGIKHLLEAARKFPMYEFWFTGSGPLEDIIKGENIKNYGFVDNPEDLMREATICIFPSFVETLPLVGLEAMACGKPVIATPAGFSEYIKHRKDGFIIEPKSTQAITESITLLMNNYELRKILGANARKKAEQYSWDIIYNQYADLFQGVINGDNTSMQ